MGIDLKLWLRTYEHVPIQFNTKTQIYRFIWSLWEGTVCVRHKTSFKKLELKT